MVTLQLQDLVLWDLALARVLARTPGLVRAAILGLVPVAPAVLVLEGLTREVPVLGDPILAVLTLAAPIPEALALEVLTPEALILGLEDLAAEVL